MGTSRIKNVTMEYIRNKHGNMTTDDSPVLVILQLQVVSICLLEELISSLYAADTWLPVVKQHSLLECLLASVQSWIQVRVVIIH